MEEKVFKTEHILGNKCSEYEYYTIIESAVGFIYLDGGGERVNPEKISESCRMILYRRYKWEEFSE